MRIAAHTALVSVRVCARARAFSHWTLRDLAVVVAALWRLCELSGVQEVWSSWTPTREERMHRNVSNGSSNGSSLRRLLLCRHRRGGLTRAALPHARALTASGCCVLGLRLLAGAASATLNDST